MKCTIPEISWHNREPVLSVDIYPQSGDVYRLATGGGDCHVVLWQMSVAENGSVKQEVVSDLTRHQRAVNCVRWSNCGQYLASGDDDANIIVWQQKNDSTASLGSDNLDKEVWVVYKVLRGHKEDVYDLSWSVDSTKLLSGSVDNTAIIWDVSKGKLDHILTDHKGFVQGVCWDPKNQLIATISTDKICRVFDPSGKQIKARINKGKIAVPENHFLYDKEVKFFHDDTFKSFFRRLQFTPDGSLLIVPSGFIEADGCQPINATLVFTLDNLNSPAAVLPLPKQNSTVVRCCPLLFELHEDGAEPYVKLPYRMIFAVGTDHDIILYDTQQTVPFARFQDIHYTRLTDLTWSQDGLLLVASSTDGFCALITFEVEELGVVYDKADSDLEETLLDASECKDENVDVTNREVKEETKRTSSFLMQWAQNTAKRKKKNPDEEVGVQVTAGEKHNVQKDDSHKNKTELEVSKTTEDEKTKKPKRIVPIKIGEVESKTLQKAAPVSTEVLADNEAEDFNKASHDIKEFFCRVPKIKTDAKNSDAKPIAVRRKPRETPQPEPKQECAKTPVRRKLDLKEDGIKTPPNKKNTLYSFLKSSDGKRKTKTDKQVALVDLTLDENEAQEAWADKSKETDNKLAADTGIGGNFDLEDDKTEDFCLQIEESQPLEEANEKGRSEEAPAPKTPRRVPLITLASPKGVV